MKATWMIVVRFLPPKQHMYRKSSWQASGMNTVQVIHGYILTITAEGNTDNEAMRQLVITDLLQVSPTQQPFCYISHHEHIHIYIYILYIPQWLQTPTEITVKEPALLY